MAATPAATEPILKLQDALDPNYPGPVPEDFNPSHDTSVGSLTEHDAPAVALVINRGKPDELRIVLCAADAAWLGCNLIAEGERSKHVFAQRGA